MALTQVNAKALTCVRAFEALSGMILSIAKAKGTAQIENQNKKAR